MNCKILSSLNYSEVSIIRPPMVLVESDINSEQVSLMRPLTLKLYFGTETSGLNGEGGLNFELSLYQNFIVLLPNLYC